MHRSTPSRTSRGGATVLWAVVLVLAAGLLYPTAEVIDATVDRARARTAADAAALAGAQSGRALAESIARDNDGELESYTEHGLFVEVTVRVDSRRATARAERVETIIPWDPVTIP